jgi:hypothetical protein
MFKYPCSYLIYSPAFAALPSEMRDYVWRRIGQVLNGRDTTGDFAHLSAGDRLAIRQILSETHDQAPDILGHD